MFKLSSDVLANFRGVQSALRELLDKIADIYRRLRSVEDRIDGIPLGSSSSGVTLPIDAVDVDYDNATSGLAATNVQVAIDELAANGGGGGSDRSAVTALSSSSGVVTVDCAAGDFFTLTLTENVTSWVFNNLAGPGVGMRLMIVITQDSTARTVSWPATFAWVDATEEPISAIASSRNALVIETVDEGDTWIAHLRNNVTRIDELPDFDPLIAFSGGGKGFWLEFDDYANLRQNSDTTGSVANDGDPVGYITDLSGNGNNFVQTAGGSRPLAATDTYKCLTFDGVNDSIFMNVTTPDLSASMLMFVALKSSDATSLIAYKTSGGGNYLCAVQSGSGSDTQGGCGTPTYYRNGTLISGTTRADLHTAYHDDTWCVVEIRGINFSTWTDVSLKLFGYGSFEFAGKVNAIFLCDTPTSDIRDALRTYFGARVGLSI